LNPSTQLQAIGAKFGRLAAGDVAVIERLLQHALPEDYRDFLRDFGSCAIAGEGSVANIQSGEVYPVDVFLGAALDDCHGGYGLLNDLRQLIADGSVGLLCVAQNLMGDRFYLDTHKQDIFYVRYLTNRRDSVARSFSEFVDRIGVQRRQD
jgi:hypothetical protein